MILISHRGNLNCPNEKVENLPERITKLLNNDWHVEIDVWFLDGKIFLGHDKPEHEVELSFLKHDKLWCHAKNLEALQIMLNNDIHCFWHEQDERTLTSKGFIWTYPDKDVGEKSIIVCTTPEETEKFSKMKIAGVCSDYLKEIK